MRRRRDRSLVFAALAACLALVAGCSRGPDGEVLRSDLQSRLDQHFEKGLFRVGSLRRMGSAPFRGEDDTRKGLFVYYSAELELERDYSLTAWKGLNLGTLAFVLGATESGISGFRSRGNAAGDVLRVHGRLSYHERGDGWVRADDTQKPQPEPAAAAQDLRGFGPDALLRGARELLARSPETARETKDAVIVGELRRAVSRIDLRIARIEGKLTFGAGPSSGTYHAFGVALSDFAMRHGLPIYSYESEGSLENGVRLQDRTIDLGLLQSNVAELLYEGWSEEGIFPNRDLRAVASLWPEAVHLVTLESTGIQKVRDLRGRRLAIGQRGSGTRFNAAHIAVASGIRTGEVPEIRVLALTEAIAALERGAIDALFVTEAFPSPTLQAFAARRSDVRFVSIDPAVVRQLSDEHFAYYPLTLPARTYPGQSAPVTTLGLACTLVTTRHVADEAIEGLLELLVDSADELSRRNFRAAFVSPETMRRGIAVPLHPAAERFYARREASEGERTEQPEEAASSGS